MVKRYQKWDLESTRLIRLLFFLNRCIRTLPSSGMDFFGQTHAVAEILIRRSFETSFRFAAAGASPRRVFEQSRR